MKASRAAAFLLAVLFCGIAAASTSAAILVVTKTEDTNDGICDADCSLREAVAVAAADDGIVFSALFNTPQTITLTLGQIAITRNLTITGTGTDMLAISGNNANRIFRITGGAVSMSGMKLTNGLASGVGDAVGGAIYQTDSSLTLTNMTVSNNVARQVNQPSGVGGGLCVNRGALTVRNSTISNNTVPPFPGGRGGGISGVYAEINVTDSSIDYNSGDGIYGSGDTSQQTTVTIDNSNIRGNTGTAVQNPGGGAFTVRNSTILNNGGGVGSGDAVSTLNIDRCDINNNGAGVGNSGSAMISNSMIRNNTNLQIGGIGGGIGNTGTMYILNTSIINNTAFEAGGGIYNSSGLLYLTNSTVSGNLARNGIGNNPCPGGGIHNAASQGTGTLVLTNSTVTNNQAHGAAGGICNQAGATLIVRNSIIAGNMGTSVPDLLGVVVSEGNNLIGNTAGSSGWIASDLLNLNPILGPLGNNGGLTWTHALLPNSPAINAANNELARDPLNNSMLIYDQRGNGFPRIVGFSVDIGAYEANYAMGPVTVGGRVIVNTFGRGIPNVRITLTSGGTTRYAQTNPFGYFRFVDLMPGTTYEVAIMHKYYLFDTPQYFTADQNRSDLNFTAR
jgi:CSLREA domain-containing protein